VWNSLEVVKVIVPVISALMIAGIGFLISQRIATFQTSVQSSARSEEALVQKRIELYGKIGTKLNQMFAYYMYVGRWKELSPADIVADKRELDEIVFTYEPFFSKGFVDDYNDLIKQMFQPYQGWGKDARLRTIKDHRNEFYRPKSSDARAGEESGEWKPEWDDQFTGEDNTQQIRVAYSKLISALPIELNIGELASQKARSIGVNEVAKPNLPPKQ
jgi:hypothetical protein